MLLECMQDGPADWVSQQVGGSPSASQHGILASSSSGPHGNQVLFRTPFKSMLSTPCLHAWCSLTASTQHMTQGLILACLKPQLTPGAPACCAQGVLSSFNDGHVSGVMDDNGRVQRLSDADSAAAPMPGAQAISFSLRMPLSM
jgi:hypothetical protein